MRLCVGKLVNQTSTLPTHERTNSLIARQQCLDLLDAGPDGFFACGDGVAHAVEVERADAVEVWGEDEGRGGLVGLGGEFGPGEVGQDGAYAQRSATRRYRTTPLRGLWNPPQLTGPYFHDGSAATLEDVVEHYVRRFRLSLTSRQKADLVEFLKSL